MDPVLKKFGIDGVKRV